jgi:hypothetical protein
MIKYKFIHVYCDLIALSKQLKMKKLLTFILLVALTSANVVPTSKTEISVLPSEIQKVEKPEKTKLAYHKGMKRSEVEEFLGRKMTLSEKFAFLMNKEVTVNLISNAANEGGGMNGLAIAGFVSSIVGLFILPIVFSTTGLVLSAIALGQVKKKGQTGKGLALAGMIAGIVGAAFILLGLAIL